ncbi:MAG: iron chelate uptake ABC transporter family permease subunit [Microbacterium sp.]
MIVVRRGAVALRLHARSLAVTAALAAVTVAISFVALTLGDLLVTPPEVLTALLGGHEGIVTTVVRDWRLPRVIAAAVFGAALGASGAVFQSLTRNPLASPDVIGLEAGSYAGGIAAIILFGGGFVVTATGSLLGGVLTAVAVYALAYRRGILGFRLIIVGIGMNAMLIALGTYLMLRARREVAMAAAVWGAGSLNPVGWPQVLPAVIVIVLALVPLCWLAASQRQLELGDDAARAAGVLVETSRGLLVVCGVVLTAIVTAAAGPIAFISLAAPQIARRLAGAPGIALGPAAALGALLLAASDIVAQHALPVPLPVGVITVVVGGCYLVWILVHEARRRR